MKLVMQVKTRQWVVKPYLFFVMMRARITRRMPDSEHIADFIMKYGISLTPSVQ